MEKGITGQADRIRALARPLSAVGLTLLLALGAVSLASAKGSTIHAGGALAHLWLLFAFLSFAGAGTAAHQLLTRRFGTEHASEAAVRFNRAVLVVAAILAIALPAAFYLARPADSGVDDTGTCPHCVIPAITAHAATEQAPVPHQQNPQPPKSLHLTTLLTIAGSVLAVLVIAVVIYLLVRMLRTRRAQPILGAALPAREMVDDADLERAMLAGRAALEGEARAAIIACYAAMEQSLAAAGVPLLKSDSPADLLARAAAGGLISGRAPARLAELFREARFSTHPMNEARLADARAALEEILAQVTARQEAAAALAAQAAASAAGSADGGRERTARP